MLGNLRMVLTILPMEGKQKRNGLAQGDLENRIDETLNMETF